MQVANTTKTSVIQNGLLDLMLVDEIYAPMVAKQSVKNLTQTPSGFLLEQQHHMHRFLEAHCDCV